jgi:hypothetical protein
LNFRAKTNSYFGPPYATTTKVQRALCASKRLLVLESKTTLADIPFCDRFFVMERWVVTSEKTIDGQYHATLSISAQVFITKKCPFESQIFAKSQETILDIAQQWTIMAQEALKLTEEARRKRIEKVDTLVGFDGVSAPVLLEEGHTAPSPSDDDDTESIEVQHIGRSQSWVLGEEEEEEEQPKGNRRRVSSIGKMSRSISKYVRRSSSDLMRKQRSSSVDVVG